MPRSILIPGPTPSERRGAASFGFTHFECSFDYTNLAQGSPPLFHQIYEVTYTISAIPSEAALWLGPELVPSSDKEDDHEAREEGPVSQVCGSGKKRQGYTLESRQANELGNRQATEIDSLERQEVIMGTPKAYISL